MKKLQLPFIFLICLVINTLGADSKRQMTMSIYEVCDSNTKKVKIDGFFKGVQLYVDVE